MEELRALPVGPVKLDDIADVTQVEGPQQMTRIDGERSVSVTGTATGSNLGATTKELQKRAGRASTCRARRFTIGGVSADQEDAFGDLGLAMLAAIAIVFMIMVATFRSLVQPLILLVSIPFAATGAIGLLLATGTPLGVPAMIGMLMLIGIVVTNAIVLIDLINQYRAQGMGVPEAVIEGGRRRLRPILMTALATIFALLPMALRAHRRGRLHLPAAGGGGDRRPDHLDPADAAPGADALRDGGAHQGVAAGSGAAGAGRATRR